jgi:hypothetical protein
MSNPYPPPPKKMSAAEKTAMAAGCTFVALINLLWFAVAILIVAALMKFVFG